MTGNTTRLTEACKYGSIYLRPHGQAVKTSPFHGGNTGSIPVGVIYADVAQLAEQLICNQQVIGSSPIIGFSQFILRIKMSQFHIERFKWADSRVAKGDRL